MTTRSLSPSDKQSYSAGVESGFEDSSYVADTFICLPPIDCGDTNTRGNLSGDLDNFSGTSQQTENAQISTSGPHDVDLGSIMMPEILSSLQDPFFQNAHLALNNSDYRSSLNTPGLGFPATSGSHSSASNVTYSSSSRSPEGVFEDLPDSIYATNSVSPNPAPQGRRERKHPVQLAPDQPLTTHGKPRRRVYVACVQCRSRKIRCDGARPMCHNCGRRTDLGELCSYDPEPKRRGPDRQPGARQWPTTAVASERPPRRRRRNLGSSSTATGEDTEAQVQSTGDAVNQTLDNFSAIFDGTTALPHTGLATVNDEVFLLYKDGHEGIPVIPYNVSAQFQQAQPLGSVNDLQVPNIGYDADDLELSLMSKLTAFSAISCPLIIGNNRLDEELDERIEEANVIGPEPGLQFTRETWWDALLSQYALIHDSTASLTVGLRQAASRRIVMDLRKLFRSLPYWFSFINVPRFFGALLDPSTRNTLQPSLILTALAVATFIQSSESELGLRGRMRALALQEQAQSALEASLNAGWIDCGLVQATLLIGFFEISAHPLHNKERARRRRSPCFRLSPPPRAYCACFIPALGMPEDQWNLFGPDSPQGCSCLSYTMAHACPEAVEYAPLLCWMPAWTDVSESEIRKEECRRLAWSSLMVVASHSSYATSDNAFSPLMDLFIMDPANYALLFPGEHLEQKEGFPTPPSKDSAWALYMRILLLWHSCVRMRLNPSLNDAEKAQFAVTAWLEMDAIEDAMDRHTCGAKLGFMQGREILFNSRMHVSFEFRRYIPQAYAGSGAKLLFYDKKAEDWLNHQAVVASTFSVMVDDLVTRPFLIFWLLSQITRSLTLWSYNTTLAIALDVAKSFLTSAEHLMAIWPCSAQYRRYKILHERLTAACYTAGVPPPATGLTTSPMLW
ncbi:hypothetical protein A0H81_09136 [Grifola frondosa]|uniref:Zn(2)-C6 fungal-type domain-containing protein n=1 Tax=Grifola frondosa TaxID=5627 RepID=A0A1C7M3U2_GRIFR|nr:hypothetical protein A0H81_09136 [Grifola frondosa]